MPGAIKPHPHQEGLATALAQAESLDPKQLGPGRIAIAPLGDRPLVQGRRWGKGRRGLRLASGPAAMSRQAFRQAAHQPWACSYCCRWQCCWQWVRHRLWTMPLLFIGPGRQRQVALNHLAGLGVVPVAQPHQQVNPRAAAPELVLAAALVAEPGAAALAVIKAVAIPAAAGRTRLVAAIELGRLQAGQRPEDGAPAALGRPNHVTCHCYRSARGWYGPAASPAPGSPFPGSPAPGSPALGAPDIPELAACSAAMAASSTWRSTADRLRAPWRRRCSSQANCASVIETLMGDAKEAMQTRNSEPSLSMPSKAC